MREGSRRRFARIIWGGVRIKTSKMAKHSDNAKWHRRSNIGPIKERSNLPLARLAAAFGKPRSAAEAFSPRRDGTGWVQQQLGPEGSQAAACRREGRVENW
ncbi:uncharacterized protein VSU04_004486 isoform 3-T3 [Chlamydotis macqueenii]